MPAPNLATHPRCNQGHHDWSDSGTCRRGCGKSRGSKAKAIPAATAPPGPGPEPNPETTDQTAPIAGPVDELATRRRAAVQKLRGEPTPPPEEDDEPEEDKEDQEDEEAEESLLGDIHPAELVAPGIVTLEIAAIKAGASWLMNSEVLDAPDNLIADNTESLKKWLKWKFPNLHLTPTGALLIHTATMAFAMVASARKRERATPPPIAASVTTAAPPTTKAPAIVPNAANPQPTKTQKQPPNINADLAFGNVESAPNG